MKGRVRGRVGEGGERGEGEVEGEGGCSSLYFRRIQRACLYHRLFCCPSRRSRVGGLQLGRDR